MPLRHPLARLLCPRKHPPWTALPLRNTLSSDVSVSPRGKATTRAGAANRRVTLSQKPRRPVAVRHDGDMTADGGGQARRRARRRPRSTSERPIDETATTAADDHSAATEGSALVASPTHTRSGGRSRSRSDDAAVDRGLRDLVGPGPSQLGVSGALRGRDVDRPTAADLAEAERNLLIVRRHWRPPTS